MFKVSKTLLAVSCVAFSLPGGASAESSLDGWCTTYVSSSKEGLHRLSIVRDKSGEIKIHAWAAAFPDDIDWGEVKADVYPDHSGSIPNFIAHFTTQKLKSMLVIVPNTGGNPAHPGGLIRCTLYEEFTDGRPQEYICADFRTETKK